MRPTDQARYVQALLDYSQEAMATMPLEYLELIYERGRGLYEKFDRKMPLLADNHPIDDEILGAEIEFLGKLIECIKIQRRLAPMKLISAQHKLTFQQNVSLQ